MKELFKKIAVFNLDTGHIFIPAKELALYQDDKYVHLEVDEEIIERINSQKLGQYTIECLQGKGI